jgi:hypothetical protein
MACEARFYQPGVRCFVKKLHAQDQQRLNSALWAALAGSEENVLPVAVEIRAALLAVVQGDRRSAPIAGRVIAALDKILSQADPQWWFAETGNAHLLALRALPAGVSLLLDKTDEVGLKKLTTGGKIRVVRLPYGQDHVVEASRLSIPVAGQLEQVREAMSEETLRRLRETMVSLVSLSFGGRHHRHEAQRFVQRLDARRLPEILFRYETHPAGMRHMPLKDWAWPFKPAEGCSYQGGPERFNLEKAIVDLKPRIMLQSEDPDRILAMVDRVEAVTGPDRQAAYLVALAARAAWCWESPSQLDDESFTDSVKEWMAELDEQPAVTSAEAAATDELGLFIDTDEEDDD